MNRKRKELEKRLSLGGPARPPDDLLSRIKEEIPAEITVGQTTRPRREQPFREYRWQIAASLILLLGVGYLTTQLTRNKELTQPSAVMAEAQSKAADSAQSPSPQEFKDAGEASSKMNQPEPVVAFKSDPLAGSSVAEAQRARATERVPKTAATESATEKKMEQRRQVLAEAPSREEVAAYGERDAAAKPTQAVRGAVAGVVDSVAANSAPAPPVPAPVAPPSLRGDRAMQETSKRSAADSRNSALMTQVAAETPAGGDSYDAARRYLLNKQLPPAELIRPGEFINAFEYGDPPPRRGDFAITAEGSLSPFPSTARKYVVRFGVRGRDVSDRKLQSIARDAIVKVEFNPRVVARFRRIGGSNEVEIPLGELGAGHKASFLYEIELKSNVPTGEPAATMTLDYEPALARGSRVEVTRSLRASEMVPTWEGASRSLKLASLLAALGESLAESPGAASIEGSALLRRAQSAQKLDSDSAVNEVLRLIEIANSLQE